MNEQLIAIARRLGFDTLETRNSDRLDFREVPVWQVREALEAAYEAGSAGRVVILTGAAGMPRCHPERVSAPAA